MTDQFLNQELTLKQLKDISAGITSNSRIGLNVGPITSNASKREPWWVRPTRSQDNVKEPHWQLER